MKKQGRYSLLLISALKHSETLAQSLSREMGVEVQVAFTRRAAHASLRRREYDVVVTDRSLVNDEEFDLLCAHTRYAIPMHCDIAAQGEPWVQQQIRSILERRTRDAELARSALTHKLEDDLSADVTGLLLQSDLILREKVPAPLAARLLELKRRAEGLRGRLRSA